jgi:hypothetical protein
VWYAFLVSRTGKLVLAGLLIREAFAPWTGHPFDFELWVRLGYGMTHGFNPYGVLPPVSGLTFANIFSVQGSATIAYLPFWPLLTAAIYTLYSWIGFGDRFVYYFLLKQPVVISDVLLAYIVFNYTQQRNPEKCGWVLRFWLFSPIAIIISGLWGMFDSIAMVFVMLSMSSSALRSCLWSGIATWAKSIPIVFAAPLTLKRITRPQYFIISILVPASLSVAVFILMGWRLGNVSATLLSTIGKGGETMSAWDVIFFLQKYGLVGVAPGLFNSFVETLWVPCLLVLTAACYRIIGFETDRQVLQSMLVLILGFLIFRYQINEQYSIYLLPLAAVDVAIWSPGRSRLLILTSTCVLGFLLANNFLLIRFAAPVYPGWQQLEANLNLSYGFLRDVAKLSFGSAFTVLNTLYLISIFRSNLSRPKSIQNRQPVSYAGDQVD